MNKIKPVFMVSFAFILMVLLFPLLVTKTPGLEAEITEPEITKTPVPTAELWMRAEVIQPEDRLPDKPEEYDTAIYIKLISKDGLSSAFTLRDYLIGVVAAEMPALFEPEALKAQAVAARTYSIYRMKADQVHEGGALCSDPGCCNAYLTDEALKEKWGADYEANLARITGAVLQTDGICLSYNNEPIFAAFHSSSVEKTENSESVWRNALPYLRSASSIEDEDSVPNYISRVTISYKEIQSLVKEAYPKAKLSSKPEGWLTGAEYTENGRLIKVSLGGVELKGTELRALLKLRSTAVTWRFLNDGIMFETKGYGHGVGMSQYGANAMAKRGADYQEILMHYYTDVDITVISTLLDENDSV